MEGIAYVLILFCTLGVLFFAVFFRQPPRINK